MIKEEFLNDTVYIPVLKATFDALSSANKADLINRTTNSLDKLHSIVCDQASEYYLFESVRRLALSNDTLRVCVFLTKSELGHFSDKPDEEAPE